MPAYNGEGVNALVCAVDDLKKSGMLFVDKNLSQLMKCLAFYPEFRDALVACNKNFDYGVEKSIAIGTMGELKYLRLPKDNKKLIALVANLLLEFDAGALDIMTFAKTYYPSNSMQQSFALLIEKVVEPFKLALVDAVLNGVAADVVNVERTVSFASEGVASSLQGSLEKMVDEVRASNAIGPAEREDFICMLEGFAAALDLKDALLIRAIWLGLRRALASARLCRNSIPIVDDTLRLYLVVK